MILLFCISALGRDSLKLFGVGDELKHNGNNYSAIAGKNLRIICETQVTLENVSINLERIDQNGSTIPLAWSNETNASGTSSAIFTIYEMSPLYQGIYLCHVSTALDNLTMDIHLSNQERLPTTSIPTKNRPTTIPTSNMPTSNTPTTSANQITQKPVFCTSEVKEGIVWLRTLAGMIASSKCAQPAQGKCTSYYNIVVITMILVKFQTS